MRNKLLLFLLIVSLKGFANQPFPFLLYPNAVVNILHDEENIYVAKYDSLIVIDKQSGMKKVVFRKPEKKEGKVVYDGLSTMSLHKGRLWLGTDDGVIMDYYKGCLTRHEYEGNPTPFSVPPITGIAFDSQDRMVVGFYNQVGWIDGNTVTGACEIPSLVTEQCIHTMVMDDADTLWVTGTGFYPRACFSYYTIEKGLSLILEGYDTLPFGSGPACGLVIDSHHNKWFCVANKLACFDGKTFKSYDLGDGGARGFGIDVTLGNDNAIWVPMRNGQLVRFSESGEWTLFPCGIETERWFCIDIDGDDIYIGTDHGMLKFRDGVYSELDLTTTSMPNSCVLAPDDDQYHSYNLQGQRLNAKLAKGIYIQNGKKYVVK